MHSFKDSTVLITGANNPFGMGAATARAFAKDGAKVAITYLRIGNAEGRHEARPSLRFGPIDVLINNAAHYEEGDRDTIFNITPECIDRTFSINTRAAILLTREFALRHRRRGATRGRIINLSSDAAQSFAGQISYGASKAAIESATRSIAAELGPLGITVNAVAPGPVQTGYIAAETEERLAQAIPLRRIGTPIEIANAIVFLASPDADWITGQVLRVAGGHVL